MTCILGIEYKGVVYMAGDSSGTRECLTTAMTEPKVFQVGNYLIGTAGSFRIGQLLEYHLLESAKKLKLNIHPCKMSDRNFLVTHFIPSLRHCLKEGGYSKIENNVELGSMILVGYKGKLYEVGAGFYIEGFQEGIRAIGCGRSSSLGALMALLKRLKPTKIRENRIIIKNSLIEALEITAKINDHVCAPFVIKEL